MSNLRTIVRGTYDIQKLRIQMGNRIVANFKAKLGQTPGTSEEELNEDAKKILADMRRSYKKITDGVTTLPMPSNFKGDEVISDFTELCLIAEYIELETQERRQFYRLGKVLEDYPMWTEFLEEVRGVGPAMAGVILSEIDIHAAEYPSSLWMYAGLDVAPDGAGRSKRKEHLVDRDYINSKGEEATKKGITFNPFLKTKLIGVLGPSFLRAGKGGYSDIYYNYKHRLENSPAHADKTKKHRHNMAIRYMIKRFLVDVYIHWRRLEGLPVAEEYSVAKLGMAHKQA